MDGFEFDRVTYTLSLFRFSLSGYSVVFSFLSFFSLQALRVFLLGPDDLLVLKKNEIKLNLKKKNEPQKCDSRHTTDKPQKMIASCMYISFFFFFNF
jgi:hypothetical protein